METQELPYKKNSNPSQKKMLPAYNNTIKYLSSGFGALYRQRSVDMTIC